MFERYGTRQAPSRPTPTCSGLTAERSQAHPVRAPLAASPVVEAVVLDGCKEPTLWASLSPTPPFCQVNTLLNARPTSSSGASGAKVMRPRRSATTRARSREHGGQ